MDIYQAELMDHYQHPRHKGRLEHPDFDVQQYNPSCGDAIAMQGVCREGKLIAIAFEGKGCVISQAAASMLCEYALTKSIAELMVLDKEDVRKLIKIPLGPVRLKCALLALYALKDGLAQCNKKE